MFITLGGQVEDNAKFDYHFAMTPLTRALELYLGRETSAWPSRNPEAVTSAFGPVRGSERVAAVEALLDEVGGLKPNWQENTLQSATAWAESQIHHRHPELELEAIASLGWAFSFWWK